MKIKIPEKAPPFNLDKIQIHKFSKLIETNQIKEVIRKANRDYLYWDKFKQKYPQELGDPRAGWFFLKMTRTMQGKSIPIEDKSGNLFSYWMPDEIVRFLQILDSLAAGHIFLDEPVVNREEKDRYLANSLMEEAISSSILEGAATTREKGRQMLLSGRKPQNRPDKMIFNNYRTVKKIGDWKNQPLTTDLLKEMHWLITDQTLENPQAAGRLRSSEDKPIAVEDQTGTTLFVPPPVDEIERRLQQLIDFANSDGPDHEFVHPIVKAVILHFALAYIHPFVDGNGRTARALFYWFMLKKGYWLAEYISISKFILNSSAQYARAYLYTEQDDRDLTYFIHYNLRILCLAFDELKRFIEAQQKRIREFSRVIRNYPELNTRQTTLLQHALRHPDYTYTMQKHKNFHGTAYQTARSDLLDLVQKGFLEKNNIKSGKTLYFNLDKNFEKKYRHGK